mmetsp:Transcript_82571/g.230244  ORF Transcript_82571/g.230244 Transcript_82571/m.230244 type:complete len:171 (+) Transcript_82571:1-513(+)
MDLADCLALLSQTVADGSTYAKQVEEVEGVEPAARDAAVRSLLPVAALTALEHVKETTDWYAQLVAKEEGGKRSGMPALAGHVAVLRAEETWRTTPASTSSRAEESVRELQASTFEADDEVIKKVSSWVAAKQPMVARLPGGHFGMLHEPHVAMLARRLCWVLAEAEDAS